MGDQKGANGALSTWLNDRYRTRHCQLTGRGASAIYLILRALNRPGSRVLIPAVACPAAVYPVLLAGYQPEFVDISLQDFNLDIGRLKDVKEADRVTAVLAIHNFGHQLEMAPVRSWCDDHTVFLIEDVCQILSDGPEGYGGDAVIASFGRTKPIDCGDGGALLLRNDELADAVAREERRLSRRPASLDRTTLEYRAIYYRLRDMAKIHWQARSLLQHLHEPFSGLYLYGADGLAWDCVVEHLPRIGDLARARVEKAAIYHDAFVNLPITMPAPNAGTVPWRFTAMVDNPDCQIPLTSYLRGAGVHVSNWYPSLSQDWGEPADRCPKAACFERRVFNLWVDETVDRSAVVSTAAHVVDFVSSTTC